MSDYEVGYKKPPKNTRFKKGRSGNLKGRPKQKAANEIGEALLKALATLVTVTINGKPERMTARRAIVRERVNAACKGDIKAMKDVARLMRVPGDYQSDIYFWAGDYGVPFMPSKEEADENR
jgi:hypothetical protein